METKCKNCGAGLIFDNNSSVSKCDYCGTVYQNQISNTDQQQSSSSSTTEPSTNTIQTSKENPVAKGCAWIFLIAVSLLAILAVCDKDAKCTRRTFNMDGLDDSVILTHVKKTYPDPDLPLKARIHVTDSNTVIDVKLINYTIYYTGFKTTFTFQVFDKKGVEIKTGDSNKREIDFSYVPQFDSLSQKVYIKNILPKAKKVVVKLKKVETSSEIWDY